MNYCKDGYAIRLPAWARTTTCAFLPFADTGRPAVWRTKREAAQHIKDHAVALAGAEIVRYQH